MHIDLLRLFFLYLFLFAISVAAAPANNSASFSPPHLFIENRGQIHGPQGEQLPQVLYHLSANGVNVSLTAQSIHYTFFRPVKTNETSFESKATKDGLEAINYETVGLDVQLSGANPQPEITTEAPQDYYENYYLPGCGKSGLTFVHSYARIVYHDVYPKIDWVVYLPDNKQGVKYDFIVHPGGNPADIHLRYQGASMVSLNDDGSLTAKSQLGDLQEGQPYSYISESGLQVPSSYKLENEMLSFEVQAPVGKTLVIDPQVIWATYFGGNLNDAGQNVGVNEGNIFISGQTISTMNLATFGSYMSTYSGGTDAFLAKFSPTGSLFWATYFGGSGLERCWAMAMDTATGHVFIGGQTTSTSGIATTGSHQTVFNGTTSVTTNSDGFIAKFNRGSGALAWSTYYGGELIDGIVSAACDPVGNLYVGGTANSNSGIGTTGTHKPSHVFSIDSADGFIAKFDPAGNRLWGTYFGGAHGDEIVGLCLDRQSNVFVTGYTYSTSGIATSGSHQPGKSDVGMDAFLAKFNSSGNRIWSSYYGDATTSIGNNQDFGQSLACDSAGNVYLCGISSSQNLISSTGAFQTGYGGGVNDGFIAKFSSAGVRLWGTYYGGSGYENIYPGMPAAALPFNFYYWISPKWYVSFARGKLWVAGYSSSNAMATSGSYQDSLLGGLDALVASFDTSGNRLWATYFGGTGRDYGHAIAATDSGDVYVTGLTESGNGIATATAIMPTLYGSCDAFLLHIYDSLSALRIKNAHPYCDGDTFSLGVYVTAQGTLRAGNVFNVQLSNAAGSFSTPTLIGTSASRIGGNILCSLPAGITGSSYKLRIVSTLTAMISDTAAIVINALPQPVISYNGSTLSTGTYSSYQWYKNGVLIPGATSATYKPGSTGQYTVRVTSAAGCVGISSAMNVTQVGVANTIASSVRVFPIPVHDVLFVENAAPGARILLKNMMGQDLSEAKQSGSKSAIQFSNQPAGVYNLIILNPDGSRECVRVVKQ